MKKIPDDQIAFYQSPDGSVNIEALFADENIWLAKKKMAELFDCSTDNISLHLKNIYQENEIDQKSTNEEFSVVQKEGEREISRAESLALKEYEKYRIVQNKNYISDFDREVKKMLVLDKNP